jgi:hypothetical protein
MSRSVTILSGASDSDAIAITPGTGLLLQIPTWDSASLTLRASLDGTTYQGLFQINGEISVAVTTGAKAVLLRPDVLGGVIFLKLRSGTNATPVNQTADRLIPYAFESTI